MLVTDKSLIEKEEKRETIEHIVTKFRLDTKKILNKYQKVMSLAMQAKHHLPKLFFVLLCHEFFVLKKSKINIRSFIHKKNV
jgi:hypothetical protein